MADAVAVSSRQSELRTILDSQRRAFRSGWEVSAAARIDRLDRLAGMLVDNEGRIADAVAEDFGCRSRDFSRYGEIASSLKLLRHSRRRLRSWMRSERRPLDFPVVFWGARDGSDGFPREWWASSAHGTIRCFSC